MVLDALEVDAPRSASSSASLRQVVQARFSYTVIAIAAGAYVTDATHDG